MYKDSNARAEPLFCSNLLFGDVLGRRGLLKRTPFKNRNNRYEQKTQDLGKGLGLPHAGYQPFCLP